MNPPTTSYTSTFAWNVASSLWSNASRHTLLHLHLSLSPTPLFSEFFFFGSFLPLGGNTLRITHSTMPRHAWLHLRSLESLSSDNLLSLSKYQSGAKASQKQWCTNPVRRIGWILQTMIQNCMAISQSIIYGCLLGLVHC